MFAHLRYPAELEKFLVECCEPEDYWGCDYIRDRLVEKEHASVEYWSEEKQARRAKNAAKNARNKAAKEARWKARLAKNLPKDKHRKEQ